MENEILQIKTDSIESIVSSLGQMAVDFGIKIIAAILILIFGIWLGNRITLGLKKFMEKKKVEGTLQSFLLSFINIVLKVFVFIIVLTTVGVQMTSIIAVLGAASLAIGMALSGTLQNFAGGMVILMFKPFKVGDVIEISTGQSGVVKNIFFVLPCMQLTDLFGLRHTFIHRNGEKIQALRSGTLQIINPVLRCGSQPIAQVIY